MFKGWYLEADNNAFTEKVFSVGNYQVTFGLHIQHPSLAEGEVMLIAYMEASKELVGIATGTGSYAEIAVVVSLAYHTRLVGDTDTPGAVVLPEGVWADVAT